MRILYLIFLLPKNSREASVDKLPTDFLVFLLTSNILLKFLSVSCWLTILAKKTVLNGNGCLTDHSKILSKLARKWHDSFKCSELQFRLCRICNKVCRKNQHFVELACSVRIGKNVSLDFFFWQ